MKIWINLKIVLSKLKFLFGAKLLGFNDIHLLVFEQNVLVLGFLMNCALLMMQEQAFQCQLQPHDLSFYLFMCRYSLSSKVARNINKWVIIKTTGK